MLVEKERIDYWINAVGQEDNIYLIFGRFTKIAKREGWTQEEIDIVLDEAKSKNDYKECVKVLQRHTIHN